MKINILKNKEYYDSIRKASLCNCSYCHNYRLRVKSAFPKVAMYLESLGIDIEKPFEISPLEPDEHEMLEYGCCQYIVFGSCESKYYHKIDDVEVRIATSYPSTSIKEEHFVLELSVTKLKYVK